MVMARGCAYKRAPAAATTLEQKQNEKSRLKAGFWVRSLTRDLPD